MRMCKVAGCYHIIGDSERYCSEHIGEATRRREQMIATKPRAFATAERPNAHLYQTARWQKLSKKIRELNPQCCICGSTNNLSVHHIVEGKLDEERFFDESILVVLCRLCHQRETQRHTIELRREKSRA